MKPVLLTLSLLLVSPFSLAGQKGNGGDGLALLATEMARRIHRESLMEPYQKERLQLRDKVPMELLYAAIMQTRVITDDEKLVDSHGLEVTGVYYNPSQLRQVWRNKGRPTTEVEAILAEFPRGLIQFNRPRFEQELKIGWGIALKTVFHEYGRAMGIDESAYKYSADPEVSAFFQRLYDQSSPVTKHVLAGALPGSQVFGSKIELINSEELRLKAEMGENRRDLVTALQARGVKVEEQKKAFTAYGRAFADMLDSMGIVPMPFPSYAARIFRKQVDVAAEGMTVSQKISETAVLDQQVAFLTTRLNQDADFIIQLERNRQRLVLKELE